LTSASEPVPSRPWALPGVSGLLLALAFPPVHLVIPPFVALAPVVLQVELAGSGAGPARASFRAGLVMGGVAWGLLLSWIPPALFGWSWLAVPAYVAAVAVLAALTGLVTVLIHRLRFENGLPLAFAVPLAWTAGEWVRANLPGPLAFPWLELGTSLTAHPEWVGIADIVGTRGVSFWLATVSGLLVTCMVGSARARLAAALATLIVVLAVPLWGSGRTRDLKTLPVGRVAIVQPGVHRRVSPEPTVVREAAFAALDRLAPRVAAARPDLVVLPEAFLPDTLGTSRSAATEARLATFAGTAGAPVLLGALSRPEGATNAVVRNSVFLVDGNGLADFRYDKHHLVPVVERMPLLPVPGLPPGFAGYGPGRGWPVAEIGPDLIVGASVCFESAFEGVSRGLVEAGASLLVNVTNDAWFMGSSGNPVALALRQHPAHLIMRAIETRKGIARAASTGFSFFVDPRGRIYGRVPLGEEIVSVATVESFPGTTPFVRMGDIAGGGSVLATVLLLLLGRLGSLRRERG